MSPEELAELLSTAYSEGRHVTLVMPNGKPFLGCRGELLSNCQSGGGNVMFTHKQVGKMLGNLLTEMMGTKVTVSRDMPK